MNLNMKVMKLIGALSICIALTLISIALIANGAKLSIRMPDVRPDHADQYLCTSIQLRSNSRGDYIVGYNPESSSKRVHHMGIYGCKQPGLMKRDSPNLVWDCGTTSLDTNSHQMGSSMHYEGSFDSGNVCKEDDFQILYMWAKDAPGLEMPEGVGFKVGSLDTGISYLVLQVHYGHYEPFEQLPSLTDNSGVIIDVRQNNYKNPITKRAGILTLLSIGQVVTGKSRHEIWCDVEEDIEIYPFRYRVHTHDLGTRVIGAKLNRFRQVEDPSNGIPRPINVGEMIGPGNPQDPQMFNQVRTKNLKISKGDTLYAHCEFNNNRSQPVNIGSTHNDEMCDYFVMYWTESPNLPKKSTCFNYNDGKYSITNMWR